MPRGRFHYLSVRSAGWQTPVQWSVSLEKLQLNELLGDNSDWPMLIRRRFATANLSVSLVGATSMRDARKCRQQSPASSNVNKRTDCAATYFCLDKRSSGSHAILQLDVARHQAGSTPGLP